MSIKVEVTRQTNGAKDDGSLTTNVFMALFDLPEAEARRLLGIDVPESAPPIAPTNPTLPSLNDALTVVVATIEADVLSHAPSPQNDDRKAAAEFLREWLNVTTVR